MSKPKVAFFDFTCCEGCQLQIANIGEDLLHILELVDVVEFREVMSEKYSDRYNIAVIEGSITKEHDIERIKNIRERSDIVMAYGSCSAIGGINGIKLEHDLNEISQYVYGDKSDYFPTIKTMPIGDIIHVDYLVRGCPVYPPEFLRVLKLALIGAEYHEPDYSVCVECKFNENVCMFEKKITCLGPITRAGCNSWCVNNGNICYGCRGLVSNPNYESMLETVRNAGISEELFKKKIGMYNSCLLNGSY